MHCSFWFSVAWVLLSSAGLALFLLVARVLRGRGVFFLLLSSVGLLLCLLLGLCLNAFSRLSITELIGWT